MNDQFPIPNDQRVCQDASSVWSLGLGHSLVIGYLDIGHFFRLLCLPLNVSSAMPDLSSSPKPSLTMRSYCFFVAAASGRLRPFSLARLKAMPESLAACAPENKQE